MPRRQSNRRVVSTEVQGDDSFVVLRPMKWGEAKAIVGVAGADSARAIEMVDRLAAYIVDWNWVDDDGNPLPKPAEDPSVIDRLTSTEVRYLLGELRGDEASRKN